METHKFNEHQRRFEPIAKKCAFCQSGQNDSKMDDNCFTSVYNIQKRTNVVVYRNVKFKRVEIGIPRCENCLRVHSIANIAVNLCLFVGIPMVFIIPIFLGIYFDLATVGTIVLMAMTFGLVYLAMTSVDKAILSSKNVKSIRDGALKEPLIQDFLLNGWSLDKPTA